MGDIARLGMLRTFQQTRIYTKMDCVDNMQISVSQRPGSSSTMFASRKGESASVEHLLEFVGLYSKRSRYSIFPLGKTLGLAMALMNEPKVLYLMNPQFVSTQPDQWFDQQASASK